MTKLKLKVWIAILNFINDYRLHADEKEAKFVKSVIKECEIKLLEEYKYEQSN